MELLKAGLSPRPTDCNYVVWISYGDLANRLLSLASAFLYALLTNRVLLVDRGENMNDLLCEPFLNVSWLLPLDFPLGLNGLDQSSSHCYGNIVKNNVSNGGLPVFLYLHLVKEYDDDDKKFFCDQDQSHLQKPSWLIMKSDTYFVPSLFLIPSFEQELNGMFPENERAFVFYHLGRYLFHPSNEVWGLITRYYHAYLAKADERIGIQIETFDTTTQPFSYVMDQILACSSNEKILPEVFHSEFLTIQAKTQKSIVVLVTSADSGYYENLTSVYGETVSIHHPSHEEFQRMGMIMTHDRKAWAEMYLLSLTNKLVTSSMSTFGYVAHGLRASWGAHWILYKPNNETASEPCRWELSSEPCFQAPPLVDCNSKYKGYSQSVVEHIRRCEDMMDGIKLVDGLSDNIS